MIEIFILIDDQAKMGTTVLLGITDSDYLEELELLLRNVCKEEHV